jgi:hypothetical protein
MTPTATLTLRRAPLGQILTTFPGEACCLLVHLAHHACPRTGRVWTSPPRLADELHLPLTLLDQFLTSLVSAGHMDLWTKGIGALRCYRLGAVFVHEAEAPENLPVEPDA